MQGIFEFLNSNSRYGHVTSIYAGVLCGDATVGWATQNEVGKRAKDRCRCQTGVTKMTHLAICVLFQLSFFLERKE
jgi:hypothetical protein